MNNRKRVILYYPKLGVSNEIELYFPMPILALSGNLIKEGYEPVLIDARIDNNSFNTVIKNLSGAVCVGISAMAGNQIREGIELAGHIRKVDSSIPIVWGGWGVSVLGNHAIQHSGVDVIVKGQGESTLIEVLEALRGIKTFSQVRGIFYKENDKVFQTEDRTLFPLDELPDIPYHLANNPEYFKPFRYIRVPADPSARQIDLITSRGCPNRCGYCSDRLVNKGAFVTLSAERVLHLIDRLVAEYHITDIQFHDNVFFLNKKRVEKICDGLIERNYGLAWRAQIRADILSRLDASFIAKLNKSGCQTLAFGFESGDQRVLDLITKGVRIEDNMKAISIAGEHRFNAVGYFMAGFPDEPADAFSKTMALIRYMVRTFKKKAQFWLYPYVPLPGTSLYDRAVSHGWKQKDRFEDYGNEKNYMSAKRLWISDKNLKQMLTIAIYLFLFNTLAVKVQKSIFEKILYGCVYARMWTSFYALPVELLILRIKKMKSDSINPLSVKNK